MVSATEVDVWLFTAACQKPRPGIEAMFCHQYVIRLKIIATTRVVISISPRDAAGWSALRRAGGYGARDAPRRGPTRAGSHHLVRRHRGTRHAPGASRVRSFRSGRYRRLVRFHRELALGRAVRAS